MPSLEVTLALDRQLFVIGEPIRPMLRVINHAARPIDLGPIFVFSPERLGFSAPAAVHLTGPGGTDLMAPYRKALPPVDGGTPLVVPQKAQESLYLPIDAFLDLREPGQYSMWIELPDAEGQTVTSNRIQFALREDSQAEQPAVTLRVELQDRTFSAGALEPLELDAVFANEDRRAAAILRPQADSLWGWTTPAYRLRVMDAEGRGLPLYPRSGTMAMTDHDGLARVTLRPGEVHRERLVPPTHVGMSSRGDYRIYLTYIVRDRAIGKAGVLLDRKIDWPPEVFVGRLESNVVNLTVE